MKIILRTLLWTRYSGLLLVTVLLLCVLAIVMTIPLQHVFPGGVLVFSTEISYSRFINLLDVQTQRSHPLGVRGLNPIFPVPSPDGEQIAFLVTRPLSDERNYNLLLMDSNGDNIRQLVPTSAGTFVPVWSPNSHQLLFHSAGSGIFIIDIDGANSHRIANGITPVWSPDGQRIAFVSLRGEDKDIYIVDVNGNLPIPLVESRGNDFDPAWSPDGRMIAFVSDRDGNREIYVMNSDSSNQNSLTIGEGNDYSPAWSPDGQHIVFVSDRDGNQETCTMNSDGSNPQRLTETQGDDFSPVWSPDGRMIAFVSDRDGNNEIYVMNADGSNQRRLTWNDSDDTMPTWMP